MLLFHRWRTQFDGESREMRREMKLERAMHALSNGLTAGGFYIRLLVEAAVICAFPAFKRPVLVSHSMSLHLGNEVFDVYKAPLQGDHNHLFIRQGTGLQGQAVFKTKLTFR